MTDSRRTAQSEPASRPRRPTSREFHVLAREITGHLDLEGALAAVLRAVESTFGAASSSMYLLEDGSHWPERRYTTRYTGEPHWDDVRDHPAYHGTMAWPVVTILETGEPMVANDPPVPEEDTRTWAAVPVRRGSRTLGVLYANWRNPRRCRPADLAVLATIGDYAAIAVENARLYAEARQREREAQEYAGQVEALLDVAKGLTAAREEAEVALRTERDFAHRVMSTMGQGLAVSGPDERFEYVNPALAAMLGYAPTDLIGRTPDDLTHPDDLPVLAAARVRRRGGELLAFEMRLRRADGGTVYCLITTAPRIVDRSVEGAVAVITDLTERRQMEEQLRQSEARFRRLAENVPDVVFRHEKSPREYLSYASGGVEKLFGYTAAELYADWRIFARILDPEALEQFDRERTAGVVAPTMTVKYRHRDSREGWLRLRRIPIYDADNVLVAVEGIAVDITELKRLEEQLLRAQRLEAAGQVASQVAHDLNNLLGPLVGFPELIKLQLSDDHPAVAYCDIMLDSAQRIGEITQDMLALGRRAHVHHELVDLNRVVRAAIPSLGNWSNQLDVSLALESGLLPIKGSPAQLARVISNLLTNAREAMAGAGSLVVRTRNVYLDTPGGEFNRVDVGEYVLLEVEDTGPGIPEFIREHVFDPFFSTKTADRKRGSGLGLSVVQAVVADHRGVVDLATRPGAGTTFRVYLPVARDAPPLVVEESLPTGHERILVVDDDPVQRTVARQLLGSLGYDVAEAPSGEAALAALPTRPSDLLLLDMLMPPGIDGCETYRRARARDAGQRALILSGCAPGEQVEAALALGLGGFVPKPVTLATLARAVRSALDHPR